MHRLLLVGMMTLILLGMYVYQLNASELPNSAKLVKKVVKKTMSVKEKKQAFLKMMVNPLDRVYARLQKQYEEIKGLVKSNPKDVKLLNLQNRYKVKNNEALLVALKPHPKSVALAQAAMESAWGTSRFFRQANNIFGVWSFSKKDKRIAASGKRGKQTIWLKKYDSVEESIEDYYLTMSRSKAFKGFKRLNAQAQFANPYLLVTKLDRYSEKGALYGKELSSMISYNKFTRFDEINHKRPTFKKVKVAAPETLQKSQKDLTKTNTTTAQKL